MERDLTYFALYLFVIVLHLLSLSFLITYLPTFFSIKKREQAAVLDSTDAKCINTFIELIFIYNRRLTLFYKELTGWVEQLYRRIPIPQILLYL